MEFVKKNMVMVVVLSVALLIGIGLSYMTLMKHRDMTKSMHEVEKIKEEIKSLIKQKPAPLAENLKRIKEDRDVFDKKLKEIKCLFGQPHKKALGAFAQTLGLTEDELLKSFHTFWKKEAKKGSNEFQLLIKFKSTLPQEKLGAAMNEFTKAMQASTVEIVDQSNIDTFILAALGLPRTMSDVNCKTYIFAMQRGLTLKLTGSKEKTSGSGETAFDIVKFPFGFSEYDTKMPLYEDIPFIMKHWVMLEDIVNRLVSADIRQIDSVSKLNGLAGEEDKGFVKFRYSITITGDMDSIRKFVNSLQEAYKENKIYIIKDVSLDKLVDEAKKITETRHTTTTARESAPRDPRDKTLKPEEEDEKLPFNQRRSYGSRILGVSKICKAVIEFEYVIYTGEELKVKK
ncbi:MAG: hypothetical protein A2017_16135 [Lentisphaerae bacterium GWF2_44_16]|nr:MAG: hypothetical protein A2017_16135 [Lentisphaerae bacterium GWF2_44_16]